MRHRAVLGLGILLAATFAAAERADARFRFCNETDAKLDIAVGYLDPQQRWVVQGWLVIDAGQCKEAFSSNRSQGTYYYFATGSNGSTRRTFSGDTPFCIKMEKFKFYKDEHGQNTQGDCAKAGLRSVNFRRVVVSTLNYTHRLTHPGTAEPPTNQPVAGGPGPGPAPKAQPAAPPAAPAPGGGAGTACQRYPNLC